jgi:hypothetical protein
MMRCGTYRSARLELRLDPCAVLFSYLRTAVRARVGGVLIRAVAAFGVCGWDQHFTTPQGCQAPVSSSLSSETSFPAAIQPLLGLNTPRSRLVPSLPPPPHLPSLLLLSFIPFSCTPPPTTAFRRLTTDPIIHPTPQHLTRQMPLVCTPEHPPIPARCETRARRRSRFVRTVRAVAVVVVHGRGGDSEGVVEAGEVAGREGGVSGVNYRMSSVLHSCQR